MDVIDPFCSSSSSSSCGAADKKLLALSAPEQAQHLSSVIFNPATIFALFNLLTDSHDAARDKAYAILMRVRSSAGVLDSPEDVKSLADWAIGMCASLRMREADAGARALAALHHMCSSSSSDNAKMDVLLQCLLRGSGVLELKPEHDAAHHDNGDSDGSQSKLLFVSVLERCISRQTTDEIRPLQGIMLLISLVISSTQFAVIVSEKESNSVFTRWQQVLSQLAVGITGVIKASLVHLSTGIHAPPQSGDSFDQSQADEGDCSGMTATMFGVDGDDEGDGVAVEDVEVIGR
jgi:hypothetical protein